VVRDEAVHVLFPLPPSKPFSSLDVPILRERRSHSFLLLLFVCASAMNQDVVISAVTST
jgi:hypothetical protein